MEPYPRFSQELLPDTYVTMDTKILIGSAQRSTTSNSTGVTIAVPLEVVENDTSSQWVFGRTEDTVVVPVLLGIIVAWAVIANIFFIYSVLAHHPTRNGFTLMLVNISLCDILFSLIAGLTSIINHATYWTLQGTNAALTCKLVHYAIFVSVYVVVYTLLVTTVFRFFGEYMSDGGKAVSYLSRCNAALACIVIWLAFLLSHVNFLLQTDVGMFQEPFACIESDSLMDPDKVRILWLTFMICAFALPLILMTVASAYILQKQKRDKPTAIRLEVANRINHYVHTQTSTRAEAKQKRQRTVLVMAAFLTRSVCWIPIQVFVMADAFGLSETEVLYRKAEMLSFCVALLACCVSPLVYQCSSREMALAGQETLIKLGCSSCVSTSEEELSDMNETIMSIISDSSNHINYAGSFNHMNNFN